MRAGIEKSMAKTVKGQDRVLTGGPFLPYRTRNHPNQKNLAPIELTPRRCEKCGLDVKRLREQTWQLLSWSYQQMAPVHVDGR